jgi:glycogen(starch) synthase
LFLAGFFYFPATLLRLIILILRDRPDVVNLHFVGAPALWLLVARAIWPFRWVVSLHGDDVEGMETAGWFDRWLFGAVLRRADAITACSSYLMEQAVRLEPAACGKLHVIHNCHDIQVVQAVERGDYVVAAGRMVKKKGFDILVRAWAKMLLECPRTRLVLVGDGPEREACEQLVNKLGIARWVEFRGTLSRDKVMAAMAASRLVIVPSRREPFGMVALEAMALGRPVVASRVGGLPEVLEGADAVLVRADDVESLATGIRSALERIQEDAGFGERNASCAARFSVTRMRQAFERVYG